MSNYNRLVPNKALPKPVTLGASDTLRVLLTAKEDNKPKRPHQVFLLVKDPNNSLETSFAFSVKESGKGKVELVSLDNPELSWQLLIFANSHTRTSLHNYWHHPNLLLLPCSLHLLDPQSLTKGLLLNLRLKSTLILQLRPQESRCVMGSLLRSITYSRQILKVRQKQSRSYSWLLWLRLCQFSLLRYVLCWRKAGVAADRKTLSGFPLGQI